MGDLNRLQLSQGRIKLLHRLRQGKIRLRRGVGEDLADLLLRLGDRVVLGELIMAGGVRGGSGHHLVGGVQQLQGSIGDGGFAIVEQAVVVGVVEYKAADGGGAGHEPVFKGLDEQAAHLAGFPGLAWLPGKEKGKKAHEFASIG